MRFLRIAAAVALVGALTLVGLRTRVADRPIASGLQRLYILDCGRLQAQDQSRWTPGVQVGQSIELSNNCYLFLHQRGVLLWETGVPDSVAQYRDGVTSPNGALVWRLDRTLRSQLDSLGIGPDRVTHVAMSHTHGDHIGNVEAFVNATLLLQAPEHEAAVRATPPLLRGAQHMMLLAGDHDVFGDGSLTLISTPGHTPGHQSLLVRLPRTGAIVLTGDVVHFQHMWDNRIVPSFNFDREQSLASIARLGELVASENAQLWIGHDTGITARVRRAPHHYE